MTEPLHKEISETAQPSRKEDEQGSDLRDQVAALIALTTENLRNTASDKKAGGNSSRMASFIIASTALIAAIGSLAGSFQSLYVSMQTSQTQREIQDRQKHLDARQNDLEMRNRLGDENTRITNIWISIPQASCGTIPLDDNQKWQSYCTCLFGGSCSKDSTFHQVADQKRLQCLIPAGICRVSK